MEFRQLLGHLSNPLGVVPVTGGDGDKAEDTDADEFEEDFDELDEEGDRPVEPRTRG